MRKLKFWQMWALSFILFSVLWNGMFYFFTTTFQHLIHTVPIYRTLIFALAFPALCSLMFAAMMGSIKNTDSFYADCNVLRSKVNKSFDIPELKNYNNKDINDLIKRASHINMGDELRSIRDIIEAKITCLERKK